MALTKVDAQLLNGAVTADSSGNVGIGTSNPSAKIEILNTSAGSIATQLFVRNGSSVDGSGARIDFAALDSAVATGSISNVRDSAGAYSVRFSTYGGGSNAERMRIDSSGNLLVNTTSQIAQGKVSIVYQNSANQGLNFNENSGSGLTRDAVRFQTSGTQVGAISVSTTATSYVTSSDYRLKDNIAPMTGALSVVQQLKPVTYTWKSTGEATQGFIAHELQAVVPDCVTGEKDAVDAEGNPVYQGIDTSFLVATLTAAIQELKAELDATKAEVAALKAGA